MKAYFFPGRGYVAAQVTDEGDIDYNVFTEEYVDFDGCLVVDMELDDAIEHIINVLGWSTLAREEVDYQETVDRFYELDMERVRYGTRNIGRQAVDAKWFDDVEYDGFLDASVTYKILGCPTCEQYPLYGRSICPYCGQKLIIPDIPKRETAEYVGCNDVDGTLVCDCGSKNLIQVGHSDAVDAYGPIYSCKECGNVCRIMINRRGTHWMF